jgi:hypothetical protein
MGASHIILGDRVDKFEGMLVDLGSGDTEAKELKLAILKKTCVCTECPTYNIYARNHHETLYCILGKSDEPSYRNKVGCSCGDCPISIEGGLLNSYYCTIGSEMEMRKDRRTPRGVRKEKLY